MMGDSTEVELKMNGLLNMMHSLKLLKRIDEGNRKVPLYSESMRLGRTNVEIQIEAAELAILELKKELREWINNDDLS